MTYTITWTETRPADSVSFTSPDATLRQLQNSIATARKAAPGFVSENRVVNGNVLTITRVWATQADAEAFRTAHAEQLQQIHNQRNAYLIQHGIAWSINAVETN